MGRVISQNPPCEKALWYFDAAVHNVPGVFPFTTPPSINKGANPEGIPGDL